MSHRTHRLLRGARLLRELARRGPWLLAMALGAATAPGQDRPADALRNVDAERMLTHSDPRIRGEAAMAAAATGEIRLLPAILRIAADEEAQARTMGLLALGHLGTPGAESFLAAALAKPGAAADDAALAAAFALARLPAKSGSDALNKRLSETTDASFKRERDSLLAMASGLLDRGGDDASSSLERLARDASLRDPHARAAVLTALACSPRVLGSGILASALRAGSAEVRCAALAALSRHAEAVRDQLAEVVGIARSDSDPRVRAAALACLTEARHLPALELAMRASRSRDDQESGQGVATALRLGGEPTRRLLARQFAVLGTAAQRRLLESATSPAPDELLAACHAAATDRRHEATIRASAVLALLRLGQNVPSGDVVETFVDAGWETQRALAAALQDEEHATALLAVVASAPPGADSRRRASMLAALMLAETKGASLHCARGLAPDADADSALVAIRALRIARLPPLTADARRFLPEALRPLLEP